MCTLYSLAQEADLWNLHSPCGKLAVNRSQWVVLKTSRACFFNALIWLLTPLSQSAPPDVYFLAPIGKYFDGIFPQWGHPFEAPVYPTWTGPDQYQDRFMFVFDVNFSWFLLFVGVYYRNLAPDREKIPAPREMTLFPTRPISWIPNWTVPRIKQNMALWPKFYGLHGPVLGSQMVWGAPLIFKLYGFQMDRSIVIMCCSFFLLQKELENLQDACDELELADDDVHIPYPFYGNLMSISLVTCKWWNR